MFLSNSRYGHGQATFHQHVYSTLGGGGSGGGGGHSSGGGHKSKNSALAMSALTLLAFLFFINMLQSCLKEQITSMNPTVCYVVFDILSIKIEFKCSIVIFMALCFCLKYIYSGDGNDSRHKSIPKNWNRW